MGKAVEEMTDAELATAAAQTKSADQATVELAYDARVEQDERAAAAAEAERKAMVEARARRSEKIAAANRAKLEQGGGGEIK